MSSIKFRLLTLLVLLNPVLSLTVLLENIASVGTPLTKKTIETAIGHMSTERGPPMGCDGSCRGGVGAENFTEYWVCRVGWVMYAGCQLKTFKIFKTFILMVKPFKTFIFLRKTFILDNKPLFSGKAVFHMKLIVKV